MYLSILCFVLCYFFCLVWFIKVACSWTRSWTKMLETFAWLGPFLVYHCYRNLLEIYRYIARDAMVLKICGRILLEQQHKYVATYTPSGVRVFSEKSRDNHGKTRKKKKQDKSNIFFVHGTGSTIALLTATKTPPPFPVPARAPRAPTLRRTLAYSLSRWNSWAMSKDPPRKRGPRGSLRGGSFPRTTAGCATSGRCRTEPWWWATFALALRSSFWRRPWPTTQSTSWVSFCSWLGNAKRRAAQDWRALFFACLSVPLREKYIAQQCSYIICCEWSSTALQAMVSSTLNDEATCFFSLVCVFYHLQYFGRKSSSP